MKNIWVSVSGALAQQRKVETLANNVANANTPGFKRDDLVFKEHLTAVEKGLQDVDLPNKEWSPEDFYRSQGAENSFVKVDGKFTDFGQGQLSPTNNPLDIAIQGKGFIEVLSPNGVRYTRKGDLSLNNQGQLVTTDGFKVLSRNTDVPGQEPTDPNLRAINLPTSGQLTISKDGGIFSGNQKLNDLSIVEFKDIHSLLKEGKSLYINKHLENLINDDIKSVTHQGFIESSNINIVKEMSELIKATRHFDSIQNAIKTYDQISGKGVNDIAKF